MAAAPRYSSGATQAVPSCSSHPRGGHKCLLGLFPTIKALLTSNGTKPEKKQNKGVKHGDFPPFSHSISKHLLSP